MSNVPISFIDFAEVGRGIEEAMANLTPEQIAEFRRTFGGTDTATTLPGDKGLRPEGLLVK